MRRAILLLPVLSALVTGPALAGPDDVMSFRMENGSIIAEGVFALDTSDIFKSFVAGQGPAEGPWNVALYITSPGGNLVAALDMGRFLRERGLSVVAVDLCASACTYMMMGGVNRVVTKGTQYGVHQFSNGDALANPEQPFYSAKDMAAFQSLLGDLHDYALTMGVDTQVVAIASHTPPDQVTVLTRDQLVNFRVDNVPSADPEGQPRDQVVIPGLTQEVPSIYTSLTLSPPEPVKLKRLAVAISESMAQRIIMAETLDFDGMEKSLANTYAINVEFNGRLKSAEEITAEKRHMVQDWGVRRRVIDEGSINTTCSENDIVCTVSGTYVYELGLAEDGFIDRNRWRFSYEIMLPMALPRVSAETLELAEKL